MPRLCRRPRARAAGDRDAQQLLEGHPGHDQVGDRGIQAHEVRVRVLQPVVRVPQCQPGRQGVEQHLLARVDLPSRPERADEADHQHHQQGRHRARDDQVGAPRRLLERRRHEPGPQQQADEGEVDRERDAGGDGQARSRRGASTPAPVAGTLLTFMGGSSTHQRNRHSVRPGTARSCELCGRQRGRPGALRADLRRRRQGRPVVLVGLAGVPTASGRLGAVVLGIGTPDEVAAVAVTLRFPASAQGASPLLVYWRSCCGHERALHKLSRPSRRLGTKLRPKAETVHAQHCG